MTKKEIIELYIADLKNLVPHSDARQCRIIDLEFDLEKEIACCDLCKYLPNEYDDYCNHCYEYNKFEKLE